MHPLTQEELEQYWNQAAEELDLQKLMSEATVHLGEQPGRIEIEAQTVSFNDDFKAHRIDVMQALRSKSGMPMLDCKVTPKFVEKENILYSATDKYNAMIKLNPKLAELRRLFPQIDY